MYQQWHFYCWQLERGYAGREGADCERSGREAVGEFQSREVQWLGDKYVSQEGGEVLLLSRQPDAGGEAHLRQAAGAVDVF